MTLKRRFAFLALPLLLALVGCDLDRGIERLLGSIAQTFWELSFERSDDPLLVELTESVGRKVAEVSPRKDMPIKFKILNVGEVNAVALPNGRIYVFRGMLETVDTEDEIASVLAHEVGHIAGRHSLKQFRLSMGIGLLADLLNLNKQSAFVQNIASIASTLYQLGYSRQHERDADTYAFRLALLAGYDPEGSVALFDKFSRREGKPSRWLIYLSTHPPSKERLERAKRVNEDLGRIYPDLPAFAAHTLVATGYAQRGLYHKAILHYEKAVKSQPKYVPALFGLARAKEALQKLEEARNWYEQVLKIEPENEEAMKGLRRLSEPHSLQNQSCPCDERQQRMATKWLEDALSEWDLIQKQWTKQWQLTTNATNEAFGQVQKLWSQMRSMPIQSKFTFLDFNRNERRNSQNNENPFSLHETMRLNNLMQMRDEIADECARTLIAFQIATAEIESLFEDAQRATELWRKALLDWQKLVAKGHSLPQGLVDFSDDCSRILFRTAIAAERESQSVREIEKQMSRAVSSLIEAVNLIQRQRSSFAWMAETKLQLAKSNLRSAVAEIRSLLASTSEKRTKVDKALIAAYYIRLSALEKKTPKNVSLKIAAYHLRLSENQIEALCDKSPDIAAAAIVAAFAKAKRVEPEKLLSEIDFKSDWLENLVGKRAPIGVRVLLRWMTNAWERDWDLNDKKEKPENESDTGEDAENGEQ
ncbi:MAG: M48 family metalloprotease [Armatimonadetes bacterium]|nr:M48 family metalloprotease [Armatimonadota bacterium]MDW8027765.1 M48 family metalloprotease [Armatimonadota bacterium]